jgi:hypothetical protein
MYIHMSSMQRKETEASREIALVQHSVIRAPDLVKSSYFVCVIEIMKICFAV